MRRRARGFTLMEILIAMALAAIVTTSVLALVRTQLSTFEMNDQVMRTQQNARAAMDFIESNVRRACGGFAAGGAVAVNTATVHKQTSCVNWYDGAAISAGSFTSSSPTTLPDALEVVYATGTMTALTTAPSWPNIVVNDVTGFSAGDYVIVSDYNNGYLFQISSVPAATGTRPQQGTIVLTSTAVQAPAKVPSLQAGSPVFKAQTYAFFVAPTLASTSGYNAVYAGMLMVDSNGVASTNHFDYNNTVQPAVEGVVDFQVAIGNDADQSGTITDYTTTSPSTDEWIGNYNGETFAAAPWFSGTTFPRQIRLSLLMQTLTSYAGASTQNFGTLTGFEDRTLASYPSSTTYNPRYRSARMVVSPRAWNLSE